MTEEPAPTGFSFDEILPYAIVRVGQALHRHFTTVMDAEGLTVRMFGILAQFAGGDALTAAQIARTLGVAPQSVAPPLDVLVARGLLERHELGGRGRPVALSLTDEGRGLVQRVVAVAHAEDRRITGHLEPGQRELMFAALAEIAQTIPPDPGDE